MDGRRRFRGVTLLEMMVVVAILGVMAALAVPNLAPLVRRSKLRSAAEEAASFLDEARQRAATQGRCFRVRIVGSDTLVMERRSTVDCVNLGAVDSWEPAVATRTLRGFLIASTAAPAIASPDERFVFRPNSRLRGNGTLTAQAYGSRLEISLAGQPERGLVLATRVGRVCASLESIAPPALAAPVECP